MSNESIYCREISCPIPDIVKYVEVLETMTLETNFNKKLYLVVLWFHRKNKPDEHRLDTVLFYTTNRNEAIEEAVRHHVYNEHAAVVITEADVAKHNPPFVNPL